MGGLALQVRCLTQLMRGSHIARGLGLGSRPGSFLRVPAAAATRSDKDETEGSAWTQESVLEVKSVDGFQVRRDDRCGVSRAGLVRTYCKGIRIRAEWECA